MCDAYKCKEEWIVARRRRRTYCEVHDNPSRKLYKRYKCLRDQWLEEPRLLHKMEIIRQEIRLREEYAAKYTPMGKATGAHLVMIDVLHEVIRRIPKRVPYLRWMQREMDSFCLM